MTDGRHIHPRKGELVEGYMEIGNALFSFESEVEETFLGGVFACRIKHADDLKQTHQRDTSRVHLAERIVFSYLPGSQVETGHVDLANLPGHMTDQWEGVLRDISVGGCSVATPVRKHFDVGDFVQFTVKLLDDEPEHALLGQIIHIRPIPTHEGGGQNVHVQFLGLDEAAQGTITRAVHRG